MVDGRKITRDVLAVDSLSNLRTIQGKVAYQILYQINKSLPFSQDQFIEKAQNLPIPKALGRQWNILRTSSDDREPDFSINNSLKKTNCSAEVFKNLQLRGFRLGMTVEEAIKELPKPVVKTINSYEKLILKDFSSATLKVPKFENIDSVQLQFFDNHLYSIGISYDHSIKWKNLDEFASQIEKSLGLPQMKSGGYEFDGKYLFCGDNQIKAMLTGSVSQTPAIHFFDTTTFNKIEQRKKEERDKALQKKIELEKKKQQIEEEKEKGFKP